MIKYYIDRSWIDSMFEQNLKYLEKNNLFLYQEVMKYQKQENIMQNQFIIRSGKKGYDYLEENALEKTRIHSIYDPIAEAKALVKKYEKEIEAHDFILFFGAGLGYPIDVFKEMYPQKTIYLYEPSLEIFYYLLHRLDLRQINYCMVGKIWGNVKEIFKRSVHIMVLPVYKEYFAQSYEHFLNKYKNFLQNWKHNKGAISAYQLRWMGNTILNFKKIYETPYFLDQTVKEYFYNKSVLIVSAGPSLNFEIENLRKIKKEKTAYIFAVGSAIHTLLAHNIQPDAFFSFDPSDQNMEDVFRPILDKDIDNVPLVFGTTIGFEVLREYPEKMAHMHINRATITCYLFDINMQDIIFDSPTIAAVLLQVLLKLQVKNIIFVGQNLALFDKHEYAASIMHFDTPNDVSKLPTTTSVTGETIYTNTGYLMMKSTIEQIIKSYGRNDIVNTTIGGAKIEGTVFIPLKTVMEKKLTEPIVEENWFEEIVESTLTKKKKEERYETVSSQYKNLLREKNRFYKRITNIQDCLVKIGKALENNRMERVSKLFSVYDDHMRKVEKNIYYNYVIMPVIEGVLQQESDRVKAVLERNLSQKELETEKWKLVSNVIDMIEKAHFFIEPDLRFIQAVVDEETKKYQTNMEKEV